MAAVFSRYSRSQTLAVKFLHVDKLALQSTLVKPNLVLSVVGVWVLRTVIFCSSDLLQSNRANHHRDSQSRDVLFLCWLPVHTVQRGLQLDDHHHVQIR